MDEQLFKDRTQHFALAIIQLTENLPKSRTTDVIVRQLLRSGTSLSGKSTADILAKLAIVEEEVDQTAYCARATH